MKGVLGTTCSNRARMHGEWIPVACCMLIMLLRPTRCFPHGSTYLCLCRRESNILWTALISAWSLPVSHRMREGTDEGEREILVEISSLAFIFPLWNSAPSMTFSPNFAMFACHLSTLCLPLSRYRNLKMHQASAPLVGSKLAANWWISPSTISANLSGTLRKGEWLVSSFNTFQVVLLPLTNRSCAKGGRAWSWVVCK